MSDLIRSSVGWSLEHLFSIYLSGINTAYLTAIFHHITIATFRYVTLRASYDLHQREPNPYARQSIVSLSQGNYSILSAYRTATISALTS